MRPILLAFFYQLPMIARMKIENGAIYIIFVRRIECRGKVVGRRHVKVNLELLHK